jgi:hypothetical protein
LYFYKIVCGHNLRREDTKYNATLPVDRSPAVVDIPLSDVRSAILLIQSTTNQPLLFQIEWHGSWWKEIACAMTIMMKAKTTTATNWY